MDKILTPSAEQVREWAEKAGARFDPHWGISYNVGTATFERFAELAAQWGASQAQQSLPATNVDFLPHDDYLRFAQRVLEGDAPESDRKEAARLICDIRRALYIQREQQAPVEEPELPDGVCREYQSLDGKWRPFIDEDHYYNTKEDGTWPIRNLFTATQMHAHFAAGVRAGTATVKETLTTGKQRLQVPTGWAAPKDQYAVPVLFNPYTGEPRDVRDVQSDPQGILIVPPGKVHQLAAMQGGQK